VVQQPYHCSSSSHALHAARANEVVCDSSGKPRSDTGGGATRRLFMQLPGVGAKTAKIWYDLGYRYAKFLAVSLCHECDL